jgi:hypothetical protein
VMALTGTSLSDSGRMVRELLLLGAVRTLYGSGQARFAVLNLVRAALPAGSATASRLPEQLPQPALARVSHGGHDRR